MRAIAETLEVGKNGSIVVPKLDDYERFVLATQHGALFAVYFYDKMRVARFLYLHGVLQPVKVDGNFSSQFTVLSYVVKPTEVMKLVIDDASLLVASDEYKEYCERAWPLPPWQKAS